LPVGSTLEKIKRVDFSQKDKALDGVEIVVSCDIDNPPYGKQGAARIFAPQKGADENAVQLLEEGVKSLCNLLSDQLKMDFSTLQGGGAAGAMGAGMVAFFGAKLKMGIETVLNTVNFSKLAKDADLVITGEGKIDSQSLRGKVVIGVARAAKQVGVPVVAIVGGAEGDLSPAYEEGVTAVFPINRLPQDFSISRYHAKENLAFTAENIARLLKFAK
jgi:glycerate kinase